MHRMTAPQDPTATPEISEALRDLFPELGGSPFDLETGAPSVVVRALNDGSPRVQQVVIAHYGFDRVKRIAHSRADRLTNPAYRAWRERLELPMRDPGVTFVQGLWRK
jgi:hypothetical protein